MEFSQLFNSKLLYRMLSKDCGCDCPCWSYGSLNLFGWCSFLMLLKAEFRFDPMLKLKVFPPTSDWIWGGSWTTSSFFTSFIFFAYTGGISFVWIVLHTMFACLLFGWGFEQEYDIPPSNLLIFIFFADLASYYTLSSSLLVISKGMYFLQNSFNPSYDCTYMLTRSPKSDNFMNSWEIYFPSSKTSMLGDSRD